MANETFWLRLSYRAGATIDALMIVPMLSPDVGGKLFGIASFHPGADYRYAMSVGASLMLGWTCLLLWADRKPVERRGVLLLTTVPVLAGLVIAGIYAVNSHFIAPAKMAPTWIMQLALIGLFTFAYYRARKIEAGAASS